MTIDYRDRLADVLDRVPPDRLSDLLAQLDQQQQTEALRALARKRQAGWRADPASMAHKLTGGSYKLWRYVTLLSNKFVQAIRGESVRQVWNLPSQYGKTSLLVQYGVPWALMENPRLRIMYLTYDGHKAIEEGRKARDLIEANSELLGISVRTDTRAAAKWNTPEGGYLYATSINGAITGWPIDVLLVDDPLKGWQEAHSEAARKAVWTIYTSSGRMRLQGPHCPIILAGTRWHEDDPSGRALFPKEVMEGTERWEHIRLPAIAEPYDPDSDDYYTRMPDPLGRKPGEPLEPERFDLAECRARFAAVGSYLGNAMEQQRPGPEEGNDIRRSWFVIATTRPPRFDTALTSWDMKLKDKESGDFVVGGVWGRAGATVMLLDVFRGQWDQATTANAIALAQVRYPWIRRHVVENTGNGPEVIQELSRAMPGYEVDDRTAAALSMTAAERAQVSTLRQRGLTGLVPENPKFDKRVRMRTYTPVIEAKNVQLLAGAWNAAYLNEMASFPNGAHDDQVDMTSQALKHLTKVTAAAGAAPMGSITPDRQSGAPSVLPAQGSLRLPGRG